MGRPLKQGLDYFSFDVDFFDDEKVMAISKEFGIKGEIATVKLLCAIYRNGYFALWNEALKRKLLMVLPGVSEDLLESVVKRLAVWGFFDKALYDSTGVLTSRGIQRRYFAAVGRRKPRKELPYLLDLGDGNGFFADINGVNAGNNGVFDDRSTGNESKVNNYPPVSPLGGKRKRRAFVAPTAEEVERYFAEKGYSREAARRAWAYYDAGGWKDRNGDAVRNWKQKMIAVWFKPENLKRDGSNTEGRIDF